MLWYNTRLKFWGSLFRLASMGLSPCGKTSFQKFPDACLLFWILRDPHKDDIQMYALIDKCPDPNFKTEPFLVDDNPLSTKQTMFTQHYKPAFELQLSRSIHVHICKWLLCIWLAQQKLSPHHPPQKKNLSFLYVFTSWTTSRSSPFICLPTLFVCPIKCWWNCLAWELFSSFSCFLKLMQ